MMQVSECIDSEKSWRVEWEIEKYLVADYEAGRSPYRVDRWVDNLLLNGGIIAFWFRAITPTPDATYPPLGPASYLKVGNSAAAATATQTDLLGGSTAEKPMDATYPQQAATSVSWRATFGGGDANFAWNEGAVKNGAGAVSSTIKLLNRKVQAMGTKPNTEVWVLTLTITIA
jgi:hypothetical protein